MIRHWKVGDQIDTIEMLEIKLKYNIKDRDQICSLSPIFFSPKLLVWYVMVDVNKIVSILEVCESNVALFTIYHLVKTANEVMKIVALLLIIST